MVGPGGFEPFKAIPLKPDGYLEMETAAQVRPAFLEADLGTEALKVWDVKIRWYLQRAITGEFERQFGHSQFRVLVVVPSDGRLKTIQKTIERRPPRFSG